MATFQPTKKKKETTSNVFQPTSRKSYDSTVVYGWEQTNKQALDIINNYNNRINKSEWLDKEDREKYRSALDSYIETANLLRGINKTFGEGYSDEDEQKWSDSITSMNKGYDEINGFYDKFASDKEYDSWHKSMQADEEYKKYFEGGDANKAAQGWQKYLADEEAAKNVLKQDLNSDGKEAWWEKALGYLAGDGGGVVDTTLPNAGVTQTVHDLRADESYRRPSEDWTEDQKNAFAQLYATNPNLAYDFAEETNKRNNKKKEEDALKAIAESATANGWAGAGHTLGAIAASPFGLADYLSDLAMANAGRDIAPDGSVSPFEYSQAVTGGISEHLNEYGVLNENIPIIGGKGWGDVYGLGTGIAQSMASAYTLGGAGTLISYFGQGAASGVDDALSRGASEGQAVLYGTALGVFEGVAEKMGIDNLFKLGSASTIKGLIKNILNQAKAEGLEEGLTAVLGNIADAFIMQDKSNFAHQLAAYQNEGLSESDAKWKVFRDSIEGIAFDTIAGAVSGSVSGGIHSGVSTAFTNANAKKNFSGQAMDLVNEALASESAEVKAVGEKYQEKLNDNKKLSGWNLSELLEVTDSQKVKSAVEAQLTKLGETSDVSRLAEVITKQAQGFELSKKEQALIDNSKFGQRIVNTLDRDNIKSGKYDTRWAKGIGTRRLNADVYNKSAYDILADAKDAERKASLELKEMDAVTENTPTKENAAEGDVKRSVAKATMTDSEGNEVEVKVAKIVSVEGKEAMLELEGGQTVKASDIELKDSGIGFVYSAATEMVSGVGGFNVDAANMMVRGFSSNGSLQAAGLYVSGFNEAYRYGAMGYPVSALATGKDTSKLSAAQRETAYNLGKAYGEGKVAEKQAKIVSTVTKNAENNANNPSKVKKGRVYFDGSAVGKTLTERQRASLKGLRVVAEAMGIDIRIFESPLVNGKRVGENGKYDPSTKTLHIDLYAGVAGNSLMLFTASHELTHHIREVAPAKFKVFADAVLEEYTKNGVSIDGLISRKLETLEANKRLEGMTKEQAYDLAYEEVVADAAESMLVDSNAIEALSKKLQAKDKSLWETIKDFIAKLVNRIKAAYEGVDPNSHEGKLVREMKDSAERLQKLWVDALLEASDANTVLGENGIMVDSKTDSASLMSVRDVLSDADRKKVSKTLAERFGVTQAEAMDWLKAETSLASLILNPKYSQFLDYTADANEEAIKSNSDYPQGTVDFSNICKKRRDFTEVMNRVLRNFPNHVFAATDLAKIRTIMEQEGMEVACAICYVEDRRQLDSVVAQDFIDSLAIYREGGKIRPDGKPFNANQLKAFKLIEGDSYTPSIYELISLEGRNSLKAKNPAMEEAWVKFNNARGMQSVRLLLNDAEYKRQILKYTPAVVKRKNDLGGLRIYSFSDAEMFHLIDIIQVITDSAAVGLSLQGYTKVNEYARAVKDTGEKLNRSLIPKGDLGYHMENGRVVLDFDTVEGIDINHPDFFDNIDNPNVGNIVIGINATQIKAAMTSKFIDQIIPFHTGQSNEVLGEKGIATWDNYKDFQSERDAKTKKKSAHQINIYTEVINAAEAEGHPITNKVEFVNKFLAVCKENNLIPRFSDFLNVDENGAYVYTEGYHKFLVDFKTFDQNTGEYLPQMPVKPIFDNDYITKLLTDYVKSQQTKDAELKKAMPKVLDRITKEIVKPDGVKYSDRVVDLSDDNELSALVNGVHGAKRYKAIAEYILNAIEGGSIVFNDGLEAIVDKRDAAHIAHGAGKHKANQIAKIKDLINQAEIYAEENDVDHNKFNRFLYYESIVKYDGEVFPLYLNVGKAINDGKYHLYDITKKIRDTANRINGLERPKPNEGYAQENDISKDSVPQNSKFVKSKFSDREKPSYAPTFYSYMGKVIDGIRLDKMGAGGVVSYLKGKGVKDEEIKWSGIEAFLEGKKSVTKAELQEFVAGSQLQIEETNSGINNEAYTELDNLWRENFLSPLEDVFDPEDFDETTVSAQLAFLAEYGMDMPSEDVQQRMIVLAHKIGKPTRWEQYKLNGGTNYREIVFKMPNSTYSNRAMRGHWGQETEGVLAHARIQDFNVNGKKMLFIEEIQSDWHNEGHQKGYVTKEYEDAVAVYDKLAEDYTNKRRAFNQYVRSGDFRSDPDDVSKKKFDWLRRKMDDAEKRMQDAERDVNSLKEKGMGDVPDAPFRNNYHEYVLKRLLRMAAEEGYDSIGWTTADIQSQRWSDEYAEGYRIEYDQDIPKFLRKYGKKWGATVGKETLQGVETKETLYDVNREERFDRRVDWEIHVRKELASQGLPLSEVRAVKFVQEGDYLVAYGKDGTEYDRAKVTVAGADVWSMDIPDSMKDSVLYEGQVFYSDRVTDKKTLDFLENQEHVTVYRAMQVIDGELYPPMAAKVKSDDGKKKLVTPSKIGAWEQAVERPDLIRSGNKFELDKANGSSIQAAYNPYFHTSASPLNDQFSSAYKRPNLVIVEGEIPASELTSGYRAEFAKDTVGETKWHSGPVASKLKGDKARRVFLSRWFKPVRVVPDSEVASIVAKTLEGENIEVPYNVVTPTLRTELEKAGVPIKYQDRGTDSYSNRSLLAGALETAAQNDIEREKLRQYKEKIDLINSEEQKLHDLRAQIKELSFKKGPRDTQAIKNLQFEANQAANRINTYDRQLLNLESTKALKGVLEREKAQARKRDAQKYKEALERYREKSAKTQRELMGRYQESREKAREGREKTDMRHKIKDIVKELNSLLLNPTAKKHIKEELRKEVADALSAINMDTVDADARVAKYNALIARESDPDIIAELTKTRDNIQLQGEKLKDKLIALQNAYKKIKASEDIELSMSYQEVIHNSIENVTDKVGNTPIRNMTLEQLEMVYDLFKMIRTTIRDANKAFNAKKGETIMQMAEAVNDQVRTVGGQPYKRNVISAAIQRVGWTFLKPLIAFRTIGSITLTNLYKELRNGEDVFYGDVKAAQTFIEEQYKNHNYKSWDMKKTKTFTAKSGKTFDLTLEQMMTLYAYSRREQAHKHIIEGGVVFEDALIVEKNKWGIPIKYEVTTKDAFNLSEETFAEIASSLTAEQKAFVDAMQEYLSTTMGEKGNEVSMRLLGVKLFKEKFYLPIKSSQYYRNFSAEEAGEVKLKSPAFSKETVKYANNPIVLHSFTDLWAEHINNMSMYHAFVLALEDFTRVYNYKTKTDDKVETMDTKATLETAYPGVTKYISKFLKDMNGGVRSETVGGLDKLTSLAKKGSVLGSWSVTIQQPSAVMRAMAMVNPKYFVTTAHKSVNLAMHKQDWAEIKKYAPIAGIKEMGRFDVGMGQETVDWIESNKTLMEKGEDIISLPPAFMDEVTWVSIWNAVKRETAHNNPKLSTSSEEFFKLAGERFTDVISMTQVYDSVFSRSDLMRNKSWIAKAATAFMAEPTTTLNMIWDAWVQAKRTGGFKAYANTAITTGAPIMASIVLNAALKSIVMAMRDDDEDESYAEKYLESFVGEIKDNLNPLTLVPIAKDIVSIFKGYDVERMDMALFSDLKNAMDAFDSEEKTLYEKWSGLIGAISAFAGVPIKNVERDVRGLLTTIFGKTEDTTTMGILNAIEEGWAGKEISNRQQLYEAMLKGDAEQIERVKGRFKDESAINSAIRKALRENDPRIKEAAEALSKGNFSKYSDILNEIVGEENFAFKDIKAAILTEFDNMTPEE